MNTTVALHQEEVLALTAAIWGLKRGAGVKTPVLSAIPFTFAEGPLYHTVATFVGGFTVEVLLLNWEGWLRIFGPDWVVTHKFWRSKLAIQGPFTPQPAVVFRDFCSAPVAELRWEELPEQLRCDKLVDLHDLMTDS